MKGAPTSATATMDLEIHQLDLRYERLRKRSRGREARLLASLADVGQQVPVVVIAGGEGGRLILLDGYKRVRALRRLRCDAVHAVEWALGEAEALLLERLMRSADGNGPLEEGWLLAELRDRFGMSMEELARRFDKSASWVSRRLRSWSICRGRSRSRCGAARSSPMRP